MPVADHPGRIPSVLPLQPSILPALLSTCNILEDGEPTMPLQFAGEDGPCVAFHMTKQDFENNLRPIAWVRPAVFDYFYRSFPKYDIGKRFVEFVTPQESESEDCMYFSPWVIEAGREALEWQLHKLLKHMRDQESALFPELIKEWKNEPFVVCADPRSSYFVSEAYQQSAKGKNDPVNVVFSVDRSAGALLGFVRLFATLFVYEGVGAEMKIGMTRRSNKTTFPELPGIGLGGSIAAGANPMLTAYKKALEGTGLQRDYVEKRTRSAGTATWLSGQAGSDKGGVNLEYLYELQVPGVDQEGHVELKAANGSIDGLELTPVKELVGMLVNGSERSFSLVPIISFLIKHGLINAENEPNFVEVLARCNRLLDFIASPIWHISEEAELAPRVMITEGVQGGGEEGHAMLVDVKSGDGLT